jgi:hypothetical protein
MQKLTGKARRKAEAERAKVRNSKAPHQMKKLVSNPWTRASEVKNPRIDN